MKKIAFIVEKDFLKNHFGVRNYFSTIKKALDKFGFITEYLVHSSIESVTLWYKIDIEYNLKKTTDRFIEYNEHENNTIINLKKYNLFMKQKDDFNNIENTYLRYVGESLKDENYDLVIITNPWQIDSNFKIHAKRIVGIVYDFIASMYTLTKENMDYNLGNLHHRGYTYYNENCDEIMAISEMISSQYIKFYPKVEKINYFKPFVPYDISNGEFLGEEKENAIILAAPFDLRKGLKILPELLNGINKKIDILYIFGKPRCAIDDFNQFFKNINIRHIKYYPYISSEGLISIYKKSKILLFPSLDEGLGFPIIEAQICGCRVAIRNVPPMNKLGLSGEILLSDKTEENIVRLNYALEEEFDYTKLSIEAKKMFSYKDILEFVEKRGRFVDL